MPGKDAPPTTTVVLDGNGFDGLLAALAKKGYRVIGPTVQDDAVVYDDISSVKDLPEGWGDEQKGGYYRLKRRKDGARFGYTVAPQGWKRFLYPPSQKLFAARRTKAGFDILPPDPPEAPMAFIGVRACELAAMQVQDEVFGDKSYPDTGYKRRRGAAFVVAVQCTEAGANCFCSSMGTGPEVAAGYDLKLVEIPGKGYVAQAGSDDGAKVLAGLKAPKASAADQDAAAALVGKLKITKKMDTATARKLGTMPEQPRWDDVATRCLTCGNCTMVCPTCFCTTVEDVTDLKGDNAERWRKWDSCFTVDFSYIHGGAVRTEAKSRYRQWITHKLSAWHEQFGTSGCVGCGRCITWCPVGIDITEEVRAIKSSEKGR